MGHGMWSQPSTDSENRAMAFTTMFAMSGAGVHFPPPWLNAS